MANDNLACNQWKDLEVRYLKVRREDLLHVGMADPVDPLNYAPIILSFSISANDIGDPFIRIVEEDYFESVTIPSPCDPDNNGNPGPNIKSLVALKRRKVIAAGIFGPILFNLTLGVLDGNKEFFGLDQYTDIYGVDDPKPDEHYDIDIKLKDGDGVEGGTGYTAMLFYPDQPGSTSGTYFFKIEPQAKIIHGNMH